MARRRRRRGLVVAEANPPPLETERLERCPGCGAPLPRGKTRRAHLALCVPDALDPAGWSQGGWEAVEEHATRNFRPGSLTRRVLAARFGKRGKSPAAVAEELGVGADLVTRLVRKAVKATPLRADHSSPRLDALFADAAVLVVDKPGGTPCSPSSRLGTGAALNKALALVDEEELHLVHRLDLGTSGALVLARSVAAARELAGQFERREVRKAYVALCAGPAPAGERRFVVEAPIGHAPGSGGRCVRRAGGDGALPARTEVEVLRSLGDGVCVVRCRPLEGRTHQVRVHLAHAGLPVLNDELYGDASELLPPGRHALHAAAIELAHPTTGDALRAAAPVPLDLLDAGRALAGGA